MKSKNNKDESRKCDNTNENRLPRGHNTGKIIKGEGDKRDNIENAAKRQRSVNSVYNTYAASIS